MSKGSKNLSFACYSDIILGRDVSGTPSYLAARIAASISLIISLPILLVKASPFASAAWPSGAPAGLQTPASGLTPWGPCPHALHRAPGHAPAGRMMRQQSSSVTSSCRQGADACRRPPVTPTAVLESTTAGHSVCKPYRAACVITPIHLAVLLNRSLQGLAFRVQLLHALLGCQRPRWLARRCLV